MHDAAVDGQDVFAEQAEEDQLHGADEEDAGHEGCDADGERVPEQELHDEIIQRNQNAACREERADERCHAQARFRVRRERQHRRIVEREEIVVRVAGFALCLRVRDVLSLKSELRDDVAQKRHRVIEPTQHVDKALVVQPRPREVLDLLHVAHLADGLVIAGPQEAHDVILFALRLDRRDDLVALFPLVHEARDEVNGVLEVAADADDRIAVELAHRMVRRVELAEVARVEDRLDLFVARAKLLQLFARAVRRAVVREADFVVILWQVFLELLDDRRAHRDDIFRLVVARDHHADFFHLILCLT